MLDLVPHGKKFLAWIQGCTKTHFLGSSSSLKLLGLDTKPIQWSNCWMHGWCFYSQLCETHEFMCRDPKLVEKIGAATALEVRATGIQYAFAPCVAVCLTQPSPMQNLVLWMFSVVNQMSLLKWEGRLGGGGRRSVGIHDGDGVMRATVKTLKWSAPWPPSLMVCKAEFLLAGRALMSKTGIN